MKFSAPTCQGWRRATVVYVPWRWVWKEEEELEEAWHAGTEHTVLVSVLVSVRAGSKFAKYVGKERICVYTGGAVRDFILSLPVAAAGLLHGLKWLCSGGILITFFDSDTWRVGV